MNRYNELKLKVLSLFATTQVNGSDQMKRQNGLISPQHGRPGRISKDYGASTCLKGVPEAEELWNTVSANWDDRGFVGCAHKGADRHRARKFRRGFCSGNRTNQDLACDSAYMRLA